MDYFLGIDAGATKTSCVLGTQSRVLARAHGGCIKITRVTEASAEKHLEDVLFAVASQSGVPLNSIAGTCVGLSGLVLPNVADWVRDTLASRVHGPIALCGDEEIALDAAFHGGRGILAIAGTGSHVVGRARGGELVRTGGWGPILSDQGSGSRIGLLALRAIFYAMDASQETSLLPALHTAWKTRTVEELVDLGNRIPRVELSKLAPVVTQCAEEGDAVAQRVLQQSGEELADLVLLAMRKATALETATPSDAPPVASDPWTVAYTGSVIENISLLRESMIAAIHRTNPSVQILSEPADPPLGALWRAGKTYDQHFHWRMHREKI
jgi:glucosamine kinase